MKISSLILSWDFVVAIVLTLVTALILPNELSIEFCKSFYGVGISVLSIVFSIFFAALAIIMASSDNDFIEFLEEEGDFSALINTFKVTLIMLFISLIYSIVLYVISDYHLTNPANSVETQYKAFFLIFEFLFCYSMIATGLSVKDTIVFSNFRSRFLSMKNKKEENK